MLTKNVQVTREIPGELGQSMTFRQLGWRQLAEAEEAKSATQLRYLKNYPPEMLRDLSNVDQVAVRQAAAKEAAEKEAAEGADPVVTDLLAKYDQATILLYGIVGWTYPDKLNGENIGTLDEHTAKWAATEIINLGKPPADKDVESSFFGSQGGSMATPQTATVAVGATLTSQANGSSA